MSIVETLRGDFEEEMPSTRSVIERVPGDRGEWRPLVAGDKTLIRSTLGASARQTIRHLVHHRAQLTVYLRLLDIPVPCTYGPTADDRGNFSF